MANEALEPDLNICRKDCKFYCRTPVFEECSTEEAQYHDNNQKLQHHTIGHMRKYACGKDARLYRRII